jgi:hypothetical protein
MKLKINGNAKIRLEEGQVLVEVFGEKIALAWDILSLLDAFSEPRDSNELSHLFESPEKAADAINMLLDANILVPDAEPRTTPLPQDIAAESRDTFRKVHRQVRAHTMSTPALNYALFEAIEYICAAEVPGAIVESGVWRGGSAALSALALMEFEDTDRDIYLFDTFDWSWPDPAEGEGTLYGRDRAGSLFTARNERARSEKALDEDLVSLDRVKAYLFATGYPKARLKFVQGLVQDTIPKQAPAEIALLRLDTDFYESTLHELTHLYPRLATGGILLVDDYPTELGAVRAVNEYFDGLSFRPFMSRIDIQGRILVKPAHSPA